MKLATLAGLATPLVESQTRLATLATLATLAASLVKSQQRLAISPL